MSKPIKSVDYTSEVMTLVDEKTFAPISAGDLRITSRNDTYAVTGGRAPLKPNSTGKVWCVLQAFDHFCQSMQSARDEAGAKPYTLAELATCWGELSAVEQREWRVKDVREFHPSVIGAKWMHDSTLAAHADAQRTFPHAEAPETISAINKARQKARRAVRRKVVAVLSLLAALATFDVPQAHAVDPFKGCTLAKDAIKTRLKSPATAKFAECYRNGELACINVDAQNGVGANVRSTWLVRFASGERISEVVNVPAMGCLR